MKKAESFKKYNTLSSIFSISLIVILAFLAVNNEDVGEIYYPGQYVYAEQKNYSATEEVNQHQKQQYEYNYAIEACDLETYLLCMEQFYSIFPLEWTCPVFVMLPDILDQMLE
ncbi:hypothetical protein K9F62_00670 [Desulfovibrio sp. JY]|nr:hypothetical protein K9F62_00670 [Desulfovibrio sp. JY]